MAPLVPREEPEGSQWPAQGEQRPSAVLWWLGAGAVLGAGWRWIPPGCGVPALVTALGTEQALGFGACGGSAQQCWALPSAIPMSQLNQADSLARLSKACSSQEQHEAFPSASVVPLVHETSQRSLRALWDTRGGCERQSGGSVSALPKQENPIQAEEEASLTFPQ